MRKNILKSKKVMGKTVQASSNSSSSFLGRMIYSLSVNSEYFPMPDIIKIFTLILSVLSLIITLIGEIAFYGKDVDIDSQYYNSDGDHIYYERSLIEKKQFMRRFPNITEIRSLSSFLRRNITSLY